MRKPTTEAAAHDRAARIHDRAAERDDTDT
jgi:hypothetical protein